MKYGCIYPFAKEELDKLGVNFKLQELCKYQQSIIDTYKDYIEKELHQKVRAENPVITPEYFISLAYLEMEEKKNVDSY